MWDKSIQAKDKTRQGNQAKKAKAKDKEFLSTYNNNNNNNNNNNYYYYYYYYYLLLFFGNVRHKKLNALVSC